MSMNRRGFTKLCLSAASLLGSGFPLLASGKARSRKYHRVELVDAHARAIHTTDLKVGENYIFHYPYVTTPCFLINLGKGTEPGNKLETEDGRSYQWAGGAGPERAIVAYSAICAHLMTHPAQAVSFINYRHESAGFKDLNEDQVRRSNIIYCCSEKSVYDASNGAQVLGGPAPQPLAVIVLEYDDREDSYYATGTLGGEMFEKFFEEFSFRLSLEHRTSDIRQQASNHATVLSLAEFCKNQVYC